MTISQMINKIQEFTRPRSYTCGWTTLHTRTNKPVNQGMSFIHLNFKQFLLCKLLSLLPIKMDNFMGNIKCPTKHVVLATKQGELRHYALTTQPYIRTPRTTKFYFFALHFGKVD